MKKQTLLIASVCVIAAGTVSEYRVSLRNDVMTWKERLPNGETDIREYQRRD